MLKANTQYLEQFDVVSTEVLQWSPSIEQVEHLSLAQLSGRVLAEDIYAPLNLPVQAISAMDGYGFSTLDQQEYLSVAALISAGKNGEAGKEVSSGQCVKIMTGAPIPGGVNAVVPNEKAFIRVEDGVEQLQKPQAAEPGWNIKQAGSDIQSGSLLLPSGTLIGAREIALLASVGLNKFWVKQPCRVAVVTSGDELRSPGDELSQGEIFDSNSWMISELLTSLPVEVQGVYQLADDLQKTEALLHQLATQVDLILTVGGASVGDKDYIKTVLSKAEQSRRWKINMKPAKPLSVAKLAQATVVALPGNPVAAFMSFQLFAKPMIYRASGMPACSGDPSYRAMAVAQQADADRLLWIQVRETEQGLLPLSNVSSSQLLKLIQADGYIRVNPGQDLLEGDRVEYWSY